MLFSAVPSAVTRGNQSKLKHTKFSLNLRKHFFYCESDQAWIQVDQRGCAVSILADTQKLSGHGHGELALGGPA